MSGVISNPHLGGSVMVQLGTVTGNTSGASTYRGTNIVLQAGSNLTIEVASSSVLKFHAAAGGTGGGSAQSFSAGTSSGAINPVVFSNGNGVSFGLSGSTVTASHNGIRTISAGTTFYTGNALTLSQENTDGMYWRFTGVAPNQTLIVGNSSGFRRISAGATYVETTDLSIANSNGISFGLAGGTLTATVATNYQSAGAYLTTAAQSGHSHAFATTTTNGASIIVGTTNSNGVTIGVPSLQTTTPTLNQVRDPTTDRVFLMGSNHLQFQFSNTGTFSTNANRQGLFEIDCQGNLTDGADVLHVHQSDNDPAIDLVHVEGWGTNVTGLRLQMSASIAAEINKPLKFTHTATSAIGSVPFIMGTGMSNSVSNLNVHYLQGRLSSQMAGTVTGITGGIGLTANTSGVSVSIPAYLTTAAQVSHSHAFATTTTNGSLINVATSGSAGVTIAVPPYLTAAAGGGGVAVAGSGASTVTSGTLQFANLNGVSFGLNGSTMTASYNSTQFAGQGTTGTNATFTLNSAGLALNAGAYLTTAAQVSHSHGNPTLALTNLTGTTASASNGFTLSLSAAAPGGGAGATVFNWPDYPPALASSSCYTGATGATGGSSQTTVSLYVCPMILPVAVGFQELEIYASHGAFSAGTGSASAAHMVGIYTLEGGTRLNLSTYGVWNLNISQNSATAYSAAWWFGTNSTAAGAGSSTSLASSNATYLFTGIKNIKLTDNASHTLSAGEYYLAHAYSMRSSNANILASFGTGMYVTGSQTTGGVYFGSATTNTAPPYRWMGIVSTTSNGTTTGYNVMPQTIHTSAITGTGGSSQWRWLAPHLYT